MSELQFAKQFLTTLDNKATKYQPDHIFFPSNTAELRIPYTLPRLQHPPHPNPPSQGVSLPTAPTSSSSNSNSNSNSNASTRLVTIRLTSSRNPTMSLTLHSLPLSTPVAELKSAIRTHLSGSGNSSTSPSTDKIKILLNKKPIPSTKKTLADAFESKEEGRGKQQEEEQVTLGVMVMGGAPDPPADAVRDIYPPAAAAAAAAAVTTEAGAGAGTGEKMEGLDFTPITTTTTAAAFTSTASTSNTTASTIAPPWYSSSSSSTRPARQQNSKGGSTSSTSSDSNHWEEQLSQAAFWDDLQVFLQQRLQDVEGGKKLRAVIEKAWRADVVRIAT